MAKLPKTTTPSLWRKAITRHCSWTNKDELLDVIHWMRQFLGLLLGFIWGIIPFTGAFGFISFFCVNTGVTVLYTKGFLGVDDELVELGWELIQEGLISSFGFFMVTWIMTYSLVYF